jgi:cell division protease FtsH
MSEPENKKSRRSLKNIPPDRLQPKMWIFWLVLVGAVAGLLMWSPTMTTAPEILTIQEVVERAEAKNVNEEKGKVAVIRPDPSGGRDWHTVTGHSRKDAESPWKEFRAAGRVTDTSMERLQKSKLFSEQPSTTVFASIAAQVIPFVIIIGLLYFLFVRQLRQAGRGR